MAEDSQPLDPSSLARIYDALAPPNRSPQGPSRTRDYHPPSVKSLEIGDIDAFGQLRSVWDLLLKHKWLILAVTVVLTVLVSVYTYKMKPVYRASSLIDVEAEVPLLQKIDDLFRTNEADDSFLTTQISIMQSDDLVWDTAQQLGMVKFAPAGGSGGQVLGIPPKMKTAVIGAFKGGLRVERMKESRLVSVSYESSDPDEAARVVNALVTNYIEYNFRTKYDATRQATGWMEQRLDELKLKVEKSEKAMVDYERQNNIVSVGDKETAAEARLGDMSSDLSEAQTERLKKESAYQMVAANKILVGFNEPNSLLGSLEAKQMELKEQYSEASAIYGPTYPKALMIQDQLKDLDSLISKERDRAVESVHNEFLAAAEREKAIASAVAEQKNEVDRVNQLLIQHNLLKREFETNQQLYDGLLQHLKDANVSAGLQATNIHVINKATAPSYPVRPDKTRNVEFAIAAGLILGIALALTLEALDNSIKNAQEIEKLTGLPTLTIIPLGRSSVLRRSALLSSKRAVPENGNAGFSIETSVLRKPGSAISEAFRTLRTSVLLSTAERPPQVLVITSAQPHEGKTATSLNLAFTLAQKGSRVLLVDADLRRPGLAKALELPNDRGLSGLLTGAYELGNGLFQQVEGAETLYVLTSGPRPPNPAELLCSMKMDATIKRFREEFDYVVIDSPPVLPITDATIISSLTDGVIMVVECDATSRAALNRACRVMEHSGGKILGTVLNKVDIKRDGYYGYRYYHGYYSYRYAAYYGDKEKADGDGNGVSAS